MISSCDKVHCVKLPHQRLSLPLLKGNRGTCAPVSCALRRTPLTRRHVTGRTFCFFSWSGHAPSGRSLAASCSDETSCFPPCPWSALVSLRLRAPPLLADPWPLLPLWSLGFSLPCFRVVLVALDDSLTVVSPSPPPPGGLGSGPSLGSLLTSGAFRGPLGSPFRLGLCVPVRFPGSLPWVALTAFHLPLRNTPPRPCGDPVVLLPRRQHSPPVWDTSTLRVSCSP